MTTALFVLVCLLAAAMFVLLGALVEMYGQLQQIRAHLNMFDSPTPLELGRSQGIAASAAGLPAELDRADRATVLFLSNKCQTCFEIAASLHGGLLPPSLWLVVVPVSGDADEFIDTFALRGERILVDHDEHIAHTLGLDITPAAIIVQSGHLEQAQTVPSIRQLHALLPGAQTRRLVLVPKKGSKAMADSVSAE